MTPEIAKITLAFLMRVQCTGQEAPQLVQCQQALQQIAAGLTQVVDHELYETQISEIESQKMGYREVKAFADLLFGMMIDQKVDMDEHIIAEALRFCLPRAGGGEKDGSGI